MKSILKLSLSVLFLTIIVVVSARYFISQKVSKKTIERNIQTIISNHFSGTVVNFEGLDVNVGSELVIKAKTISVIEKTSQNLLLSADKLMMKVPISVILGGKGTIKTIVDSLQYRYSGNLHLLDFISTTGPVRGTESIPVFFMKARHDFKIKNLSIDKHNIGRVSFKNINLHKTSAFEIKTNISNEKVLNANVRVIGAISLKDLIFHGDVVTNSTFSVNKLSLPTPSFRHRNLSIKGNIETRGKLGALEGDLKITSENLIAFTASFEVLPMSVLVKNVVGTLDDMTLMPFLPRLDLNFEGSATISKKDLNVDPDISFNSIKPARLLDFTNKIQGKILTEKLEFELVSSGLNGVIETEGVAKGNLGNMLSFDRVFDDYFIKLQAKNILGDEFKFGTLFEKKISANIALPRIEMNIAFSDLSLREKIFNGELTYSHQAQTYFVKNLLIRDDEGQITGDLTKDLEKSDLYFLFKLDNFDLDFLKAIMGNKNIHIAGKFDGIFEANEENMTIKISGRDGQVPGLYDFLQLDKVYSLLKDSPDKRTLDLKNFEEFTALRLDAVLSSESLLVRELKLATSDNTNLEASGLVQLKQGISNISGAIEREKIKLNFSLEGEGVFLRPKTQEIQANTKQGVDSRE